MKENITHLYKGLDTDSLPLNQQKNTYRFCLNGVTESQEGDLNVLSNEEKYLPHVKLTSGYVPIGSVYIGSGETVIFSVNSANSEIGVINANGYKAHVNAQLGFDSDYKIDATYRLRRGNEQVIYFTDNKNKPRIFNLTKPDEYKTNGVFDVNKFNLFKTINSIPNIKSIEVNKGGVLKSGSYNFSVQYLDDDLNPTEWVSNTDTVIIYNDDNKSNDYHSVRGSSNEINYYQNFGITDKAIKIELSNLDRSYPFYRIAVVESTSGGGLITNVLYSNYISTANNTYIHSGNNNTSKGVVEELQMFNNIIEKAKNIEQIENRLLFSNTKGKDLSYNTLQKSASKITF